MHISDGFLDGKALALTGALSAGGLAVAAQQVNRTLPRNKIPLMGLGAAFVFAAQMINFPVAGGTSGHLVGGVLAAALLGPAAAIVVVTSVLIVQCFLFADGGVLALGANILNMAIVNSLAGYAIYSLIRRLLPGEQGRLTAIAFAGWCAAVLAAIVCAGELAWSRTAPWNIAFPAMSAVHMLIGLGEGLISALVLLAILRTRPDLLADSADGSARPSREWFLYAGLATLALTLFVAPFACPWPDGLDSVAAQLGFDRHATAMAAPIADYHFPGIHSAVGATALAGALGSLVVFGLAFILGRLLIPRPPTSRV